MVLPWRGIETMTLALVNESKIILSAVCPEPEGKVVREVWRMPVTIENLETLWERSRIFKTLFAEEIRGDFKKFCELFLSYGAEGIELNGLFYVIDDFVGVFYMTDINPGVDAKAHYTFFDRRHRGRIGLVKAMLKYAFTHYGFRRLSTE